MEIFETLQSFFNRVGWPFHHIEGETALHLEYEGDNGAWSCYAIAREEERQCIFYSVCPVVAADDKVAMAEFLTRANFGLAVGNFEMDWESGAIRCKTSLDIEGTELNEALVEGLVNANLITTERYMPGLRAVAENGAVPADAINEIENTGEFEELSEEDA